MTERELSERCRKQDGKALRMLYERYAGQLMAVCLRYVADREVAQDVLHDGFLKIFDALQHFTYRGEGSLKAWMSRIMVNLSIEHLRKTESASLYVAVDELAEDIPDVDEEVVERIPYDVLMRFIGELPAGYRAVFNLYTFEEKTHKEIAAELGIAEKSSASQLFRAKASLAKKIKDYWRDQ
ncbi:MAG: RNA polymerase sigma factor [Bacteroidaceae bacterium]